MSVENILECSVCSTDFDLEGEGGVHGNIGILPVILCPTCLNGMLEMCDFMQCREYCEECGQLEKETMTCECPVVPVEEKEHPNQMNFEKELDS